jgi:hypothetical protein
MSWGCRICFGHMMSPSHIDTEGKGYTKGTAQEAVEMVFNVLN